MKRNVFALAAAVAAALPLAQGCVTLLPPKPPAVPKYEVFPAVAEGPASPAEGQGEVYAVGWVRASRDAAGRAIRVVDAPTGRSAFFAGGELASTPEAIVAKHLRRAVAAARPGALVADASFAGRSASKPVTLECWIEDFRLVRDGADWTFAIDATLYETAPDGTVLSRPAAARVQLPPVSEKGPSAPDVAIAAAQAISEAFVPFEASLASRSSPGEP